MDEREAFLFYSILSKAYGGTEIFKPECWVPKELRIAFTVVKITPLEISESAQENNGTCAYLLKTPKSLHTSSQMIAKLKDYHNFPLMFNLSLWEKTCCNAFT